MRIIRTKDYDEMSVRAADIIAAQIILKPESVLGLATGDTPIGAYRRLAKMYNEGRLDFSKVQAFNLDEYKGLSPDSDQSYKWFMNNHLFKKINIREHAAHIPFGLSPDADEEAARYDSLINAAGGIDLQLLGIGNNGHIGFNEPSACFSKGTHTVTLTESTILANSRLFERREDVPAQAFTMGIGTIMSARAILLVVSGDIKAKIIKEALFGEITPKVPASVLQLHQNVTVVGDEAALTLIVS